MRCLETVVWMVDESVHKFADACFVLLYKLNLKIHGACGGENLPDG
jgi:hypothetical protein